MSNLTSEEQIVQQLTQMTQAILELQNQNKTLQHELLQVHLKTNPPPTPIPVTTPAQTKEPKHPLPAKFNGDRTRFRGFMNQVNMYFMAKQSTYEDNHEAKIITTGGLLEGKALDWFNPLFERKMESINNNVPTPSEMINWTSFQEALSARFGPVDPAIDAGNKIQKLRQGSTPASSYATDFGTIAADLEWNDSALMHAYRNGLSDAVKDELVHYDYPVSLQAMVKLSIKIDNRLFERRQEFRRHTTPRPGPQSTSSSPARPPTRLSQVPSVIPTGPTPMDLDAIRKGPLTQEEREYRFRNGLCIVCASKDHLKADCPRRRGISAIISHGKKPEVDEEENSGNGQGQ